MISSILTCLLKNKKTTHQRYCLQQTHIEKKENEKKRRTQHMTNEINAI